jgi:hypothetical protein
MTTQNTDAAITKGRQAGLAEKERKEAAKAARESAAAKKKCKEASTITAAYNKSCAIYNATSKVADESGLRARLKNMDDLSGGRIRPTERRITGGDILISTRIPTDKNGGTLEIFIKRSGALFATGNYRSTKRDSVSAHGDAAPIIEFAAEYAEKAGLFSPKPKGRIRKFLGMGKH